MPIFRTPKTTRYTRIDNQLLHSNSLSPHAKLIMAVALSLMDNYEVNVKRLAKLTNMGQDSVRTALQELTNKGYVNRKRQRIDGKYGKMLYDFFEDPSLNPTFHTVPEPENPIRRNLRR